MTGNIILGKGQLEAAPYIVGIDDGHMSAGADNSIFVTGIDEHTENTHYSVYRFGTIFRNPTNKNDILGYEAIYLGDGILDKRGDPATIYMQRSRAEILVGHRVLPIEKDKVFDAQFVPKVATVERSGTIIGVLTNAIQPGVTMVGALDVVIIDMGLQDGVSVGDVFNIYWRGETVKDPIRRNTSVKLPDVKSGNMLVFRTFERVSYAIVMDAQRILKVGDIIKSPLRLYE